VESSLEVWIAAASSSLRLFQVRDPQPRGAINSSHAGASRALTKANQLCDVIAVPKHWVDIAALSCGASRTYTAGGGYSRNRPGPMSR
jgi:hypothetical protein